MSLPPPCFRVLTLKNEGKKTSSTTNGKTLKSKHTKKEHWWHFSFCTFLRLSSISTVLLCFTEPARVRKIRNEAFSKTLRSYYVAALVPGPQFYLSFFAPCLLPCLLSGVPRPQAQAPADFPFYFSWVVKPNLITHWVGSEHSIHGEHKSPEAGTVPSVSFFFFWGGKCPT